MTSGKAKSVWPKRVLLALLFSILAVPAAASSWTLAQLTALLARQEAATYRYAEERHLQALTKPLRLRGTLSFEPSGRLEMRTTAPKKERIVIDGRLLSIEANSVDPPLRLLLADYPALEGLVTALRSALAGDHDRLAALRAAIEQIRIQGKAREIGSIEVLEAGGDSSVITILGQL